MEQLVLKIRAYGYIELCSPFLLMVFIVTYLHFVKGYDMTSLDTQTVDHFEAKSYLSDNRALEMKVNNVDQYQKVESIKSVSFKSTHNAIVSSLEKNDPELEEEKKSNLSSSVEEETAPEEKKKEVQKVVYRTVYVPEKKEEKQEVKPEQQGEIYIASDQKKSYNSTIVGESKYTATASQSLVEIETLEDIRYTIGNIFNVNVALSNSFDHKGIHYKKNTLAVMSGMQRSGTLQLKITKIYDGHRPVNCDIMVVDYMKNQTLSMNKKDRGSKAGDEATDLYNQNVSRAKIDLGRAGNIDIGKFLKKDKNGKEYGYIHRGTAFFIL